MGWLYLFVGILVIAGSAYICLTDDRTKMIVISAMQILVGSFLVWVGSKRIYGSKRAA